MKTKTLYIIILLLAVIIIFIVIYTKGKISELNPPISEVTQVEVLQPERVTQSTEPIFFHREAITIIKPAQGKKAALLESDDIKDIKDQQNVDISLRSTSVGDGGVDNQDTEEVAGVSRLGKYPTKEEIKEMNSKGIIMY